MSIINQSEYIWNSQLPQLKLAIACTPLYTLERRISKTVFLLLCVYSLSYLYLTFFFFLVNLGGVHVERIIAYGMRFSYYIVMIYYIDLFASRVLRGPSWNHHHHHLLYISFFTVFYTQHKRQRYGEGD